MNKLLANIEVGVTLSAKNSTGELTKILKGYQSEADKNTITYKIAGDKSSMESMLKQIQAMKPELLSNVKLNFDRSTYDSEMERLKGTTGKSASQIGEEFKASIKGSLANFKISDIIGRNLKKGDILNSNEIGSLSAQLQDLKKQTRGFDLSKVTSVSEIEKQVIALEKMDVILKTLSTHSNSNNVQLNGKDWDISKMLEGNTSKINNIMSQVGDVIHKNAYQWSATLESEFNKEFNGIINLFNNLKNIIDGTFGSNSGLGKGISEDLKRIQSEIKSTTSELEKAERKLKELKSSGSKANLSDIESQIKGSLSVLNGKNILPENKWNAEAKNLLSLVEQFKTAGGEMSKLNSLANFKDTLNDIKAIGLKAPKLKMDVVDPKAIKDQENLILNLQNRLAELKAEKERLSQTSTTGTGGVAGTGGVGTGGTGTPTNATVSPTLAGDFKQKLQEQVTAVGTVDATVSGKLSDTFKSDIQTKVDGLGEVNVGVKFSNLKKDGEKKQEIPVDVTTTPKLSDSFKGDLQKLIDSTGKYEVSIGSKEGDGKSIPIKATVENAEEFRNKLKQAAEGEGGLPVKVNPIIDKGFKLEIPNATLKDVKVEGSIQGGNLKPAAIESPVGSAITTSSTSNTSATANEVINQDKLQKELEETKQKQDEAGQSAKNSAEVQKRSLLDVVKELERVQAKYDEVKAAFETSSNKSIDLNKFKKFEESKKSEIEKEYTKVSDLTAKIQTKLSDMPSGSNATAQNTAQYLSAMIMYVERFRELAGSAFSFDVLGANGEQKFNLMRTELEKLTGATGASREELNKWRSTLDGVKAEKSAFEKTATEAEQLEVKIYEAVKAVEKLKATNKKGDLVNVDSKKFKDLFDLWRQYKDIGGKSKITDFTNEAKVINTVTKAYSEYLSKKIESQKARDMYVDGTYASQYNKKYSDIDKTQFDALIQKMKSGTITAKEFEAEIARIRESLKGVNQESSNAASATLGGTKTDPSKTGKQLGKGEVLVKPKVEDPAAFAGEVTAQLKGQSATIDVKPNIVWDKASTPNAKDAVQNKNVKTEVDYYDTMIKRMNEYVKLQEVISKGNRYITETYSNGRNISVRSEDMRKGSVTQSSIKRELDSYLYMTKNSDSYNQDMINGQKEKLASYVAAFKDADRAQKIFGASNKSLFTEIQSMIERSKSSLEAYNTSQTKLNAALFNASKISQSNNFTFGQRDQLESILQTGDIDKAVQHLQQVLGLQVPQAAQQAKTAIDGIGEQARQEGQEVAQAPIQIKVAADIKSLNTDIQSKKDQITPVDVKLTGNIPSLNTDIISKKNQIAPVDITISAGKTSLQNLATLNEALNTIVNNINKIVEKPLSVQVDSSSLKGLYEVGKDGTSPIDQLKTSIDGLQTGILNDLKIALSGLEVRANLATNISKLSVALGELKTTLNGIDPNSAGFLNTIKDLSGQAEGLKNLATVIRASKDEIQKAKDEIKASSATGKSEEFVISRNSEQWNAIIEKASQYKDVLGEIQSITYSMRQGVDGKRLVSYQVTGSKSRITLGANGNLIGEKETQTYQKTADELNKIRDNFIAAANKSKISFDMNSLKVDKNGVITFTSTVEKAGEQATITKYKIADLYETIEKGSRNNGQVALNSDGSLSKKYLNQHAETLSSKDISKEKNQAAITAQKELNSLVDQYIAKRNQAEKTKNVSDKAVFNYESVALFDKIEQKINSVKNTGLLTESQIKEALDRISLAEDELVKKIEIRNNAQKNADQNNQGTSNIKNISDVENAYKGLISTEKEYQKLKAKVDTGTATNTEIEKLNRLTETRDLYNKKLQETTVLTEREMQLKSNYSNTVATTKTDVYDPYLRTINANRAKYETELARTKQLMDQAFKPDIAGFQSVFDRVKAEIDELNRKLLQGKIENVQTGYTDKVNQKVAGLNKVVAVASSEEAKQKMLEYAQALNNGNVKVGAFTNNNNTLNASFREQKGLVREVALQYNETTGAISLLDKGTNRVKSTFAGFFDGLKGRFRALTQYLLTFASFYRIFGYIKQGANYIREFDKALTEMRKVSDETVKTLQAFQKTSFDIAASVGTTAQQIQNSTADWMRLGESLTEAAKSAQVANTLLNVSEFESIDEATESLVSMSAAYDELDKVQIIDKLNLIGNNFAISTDGLATALQSSASALVTAGNDMDEAVALATAGNAVVQDPNKVGTGLRTIALRITGKRECARTYSNVWAFI